jgi:hypothetical protein
MPDKALVPAHEDFQRAIFVLSDPTETFCGLKLGGGVLPFGHVVRRRYREGGQKQGDEEKQNREKARKNPGTFLLHGGDGRIMNK